jgi:hypothetical protein
MRIHKVDERAGSVAGRYLPSDGELHMTERNSRPSYGHNPYPDGNPTPLGSLSNEIIAQRQSDPMSSQQNNR